MKKSITYTDFLTNAARNIGYNFFICRDKLFFIDPRKERPIYIQDESDRKISLTSQWRTNPDTSIMQEFTPTIDISSLLSEVEIRGTLPHEKKLILKKAMAGEEDVIEQQPSNGQI